MVWNLNYQKEFINVKYFGNGPEENYQDRNKGAKLEFMKLQQQTICLPI